MADKSSFTPEEWTRLLEAPMMAGMAVSAAEPSGLFGMLKESFATGKLLVQAKTDASTNALIKAVAADYETAEGRKAASEGLRARLGGGQPGEIKTKTLDALRQVSALLAAKAPEDAAAFKAWLAQISQSVAEAAKEGGILPPEARGRFGSLSWRHTAGPICRPLPIHCPAAPGGHCEPWLSTTAGFQWRYGAASGSVVRVADGGGASVTK